MFRVQQNNTHGFVSQRRSGFSVDLVLEKSANFRAGANVPRCIMAEWSTTQLGLALPFHLSPIKDHTAGPSPKDALRAPYPENVKRFAIAD